MAQPLATFQVDLLFPTLTVPAAGSVTPPIPYRASAIAGWGSPNTEFNEATRMSVGVPGNPYVQLVALYDQFGNVRPDFLTLPWQAGRNEGAASFKILGPQVPGGNYAECVLRATQQSGVVSGTGQWCRVTIQQAAPPASHVYTITSQGQSLGSVPATDPVVITKDNVVIYQSGPFSNPVTGDRTGNW